MTASSSTDGSDDLNAIREAVRSLCLGFPGEYWRALDRERAYPSDLSRR